MASLAPHLLVGVGGVPGANARFLLARWLARSWKRGFPSGRS
jgi:fluoride ion exporter CrcB/FEX